MKKIKKKKKSFLKSVKKKLKSHNLNMSLVDVAYTFDNAKLLFYFTADSRIDFRELVKDLASIFKTRIELRQIGVRDQVKKNWWKWCMWKRIMLLYILNNFDTVSIKMAKRTKYCIKSSQNFR